MANHLDVPREEAEEILALPKTAPAGEFNLLQSGSHEKWELPVGVAIDGGLYKKAMTVQLLCHQSLKPARQNFKFTLFYNEFGRWQRVFQLDTSSVPLCDEGDHDWPHEHRGQDRINFGKQFPINFDQSIAYFCKATNIKFDDHIESPFEFRLKPS